VEAYVVELARVLDNDGVAFLHHSNMAAYTTKEVGPRIPHWRSGSVSAQSVDQYATSVGLSCFRQELIGWGSDHDFLNDAFTWIARTGSVHDRPREVVTNSAFMKEAQKALSRNP
jgi:hypothetical protein